MCEIFASIAKRGKNRTVNAQLQTFYSHCPDHPNGWGLAVLNGKQMSVEKEPKKATKSDYLQSRLTVPVNQPVVLAHIRYATIGNIDYNNTHPFQEQDMYGRTYTLIHNGTIFEYAPLNAYVHTQAGETDSERILLYLVDRLNEAALHKGGPLTAEERFGVLEEELAPMAKGNKLNIILYDGEWLYVHKNFPGALHYREDAYGVTISTQPLSEGGWLPVRDTTLLAYCEGVLVKEGRSHENEYVENAEDYKHLYQIFSGL